MKTTLVTVTAGVVALSMLVAASSFASTDTATSVLSSVGDTASSVKQAFEWFGEGRGHGPRGEGMKADDDATRTVTVLDNGFVMEIAAKDTTDADAIAKIQEREVNAPKGPEGEDSKVVRTVENTTTGVKVTVTSTDADTAAKLVEMGTAMKDGKMPTGGRHGGPRGGGFMMNSTNTITVLDNGFVMEIAAKDTTDADAIAKIQTRAAEMNDKVPDEFMGVDTTSVTRTVENTATGVKVTVTSSDATVAAKLVEIGTAMKDGKMPMGEHGPRGEKGFDQDATRTVTALPNGFTIEISAKDTTDADAIAKIQEREANAPKGPEADDSTITRTVENTATGVKVTVTSTDTDTIEKLVAQAGRMQERETRMKEMKSAQSGDGENASHRGRMGKNNDTTSESANSEATAQ